MTIQILTGDRIVKSLELDDKHPLVGLLLELKKRDKHSLSKREIEILHYVALGKRAKELGTLLGISRFTAQAHIRNIYHKLGVKSCAEAIAKTGIT